MWVRPLFFKMRAAQQEKPLIFKRQKLHSHFKIFARIGRRFAAPRGFFMRVLITGGAGFIGSHIADAFLQLNHEVAVFDSFASGRRANLDSRARVFQGDISDASAVESAFSQFQPEVVSHHAAQLDVRRSLSDPVYDAQINILGSLHVLQNAARVGAKRFLFASSGGAIYGDAMQIPTPESAPENPESPYGLTKRAFEGYLRIWHKNEGIVPVCLRYANVYGPRQSVEGEAGVVAVFAKRLLAGRACSIFGDGTTSRDYTFVGDIVRANVLALTKGDGEVLNIGTGIQTPIARVYDKIRAAVGELNGHAIETEARYEPLRAGEVVHSALDATKAREILGWEPQTDFASGVRETVEYLKSELGQ